MRGLGMGLGVSRKVGATAFDYLDVPGCVVCCRPAGIAQVAGVVTGWTNEGSAGGSFAPSGSPTYTASNATLNGKASVNCLKASSQYLLLSVANILTGTDCEIFLVHNRTANPATSDGLIGVYSDAAANDYDNNPSFIIEHASATHVDIYRGNASGTNLAHPGNNTAVSLHVRMYLDTNTKDVIRMNGSETAAHDFGSDKGALNIDRILLSARKVGAITNPGSAQYSQLLVYTGSLSPSNRAAVLSKIGSDYGITA